MGYPIVPTVCPKPIQNNKTSKQQRVPQNWFDHYWLHKFDPIMWDHSRKKKKTVKLNIGQTTICPQFYEPPATHGIIFFL